MPDDFDDLLTKATIFKDAATKAHKDGVKRLKNLAKVLGYTGPVPQKWMCKSIPDHVAGHPNNGEIFVGEAKASQTPAACKDQINDMLKSFQKSGGKGIIAITAPDEKAAKEWGDAVAQWMTELEPPLIPQKQLGSGTETTHFIF